MSLIRGVMLAGQFRTQHELDTMSPDGQRNTLIVEIAGRSKQTNLQSFNDSALAGIGAVLVFLRTARIRTDADLKHMTADDMRNILITELGVQTGISGPELQGMSNIDLVLVGLGKPRPGGLTQGSFIRGVMLAGQFRTQHELNTMSPDGQRNTLIVEIAGRSKQTNLQSLNDFELAGIGAILVFLRTARIRTDADIKGMTADDMRNVAIVEIGAQTNLGSKLQGLSNMDLVLTALGVDPVFKTPQPPPSPTQLEFDAVDPDNHTTRLASSLPLGGSAHLLVTNTGAFTFTVQVHDSGFDNIDYSLAAVLMTQSGLAFTFEHQGGVEGTSAGLPFGTPRRDDHATVTGTNPTLKDEFARLNGAKFVGNLAGTDTLVKGIKGLINDTLSSAAKELGSAAAKAVIALVA